MKKREMTFNELAMYYEDFAKEENSLELLKEGKRYLLEHDFKKAIEYFTSSSLLGNSDAQRYLGLLYLKINDKDQQSYEIGLRYLQLSAEQKNKKTLYLLGILYVDGFKKNVRAPSRSIFSFREEESVPTSPKKPLPDKELGIKYLKQAVNLKYKRAMKYLFDYYFREGHIGNNQEKAEQLAKEALDMGYNGLIRSLLYERYQYEKTKKLEIIQYLANHNVAIYQYQYGDYLYHTTEDLDQSYDYLKKSADNGYVLAMYKYGFYNLIGYNDGHGNREEGFKYLEKAARNGCLAASYYLGLFHLHNDHSLPKDENKAIKYFHRAAIYNDPDAQIALGKVFLYNEKRLILPDLAIKYFGLAAEGSILAINDSCEAYWREYSDDEDEDNEKNKKKIVEEEEEEEEEDYDELNDDNFNVKVIHMFYPDISESSTSLEKYDNGCRSIFKSKKKRKKNEEMDDHVEDFDDPLVREIYSIIGEDIKKKKKAKKKKVNVFIGQYAGEFSRSDNARNIKRSYMCQGLLGLAQAYKEKKDFKKSLEYYQKAIDYNYAEAMNELGVIYKDGSFGEKDPQKAMKLFAKSYQECRNADALYYMGRMYMDGCGEIEKNTKKGQELIQLAVNYGSSVAHRSFQHGGFMSIKSPFYFY